MTFPPTPLQEEKAKQDEAGTGDGEDLHEDVHGGKSGNQSGWLRLTAGLTMRAAINPRLALDLVRLVWSFRARNWYRSAPFLPVPAKAYTRWRMYTAYGDEHAVPPIQDVMRFARWRREVMRL